MKAITLVMLAMTLAPHAAELEPALHRGQVHTVSPAKFANKNHESVMAFGK